MNKTDVFILDTQDKIFQYNGKGSMFEKNRAAAIIKAIVDERNIKIEKEVIDEGHDAPDFWNILGGKPDDLPEESNEPLHAPQLFKLSDHSGEMVFEPLGQGKTIKKNLLSTNDVMVLDTGFDIFVWEGRGASKSEKAFAPQAARKYCRDFKRPRELEVFRRMEGGENEIFELFFPN